ncbi:MAG: bifunctional anthranilate synthase component I family protein/class IV aminotransferase [Rhodocyclaceae bacterium]|nr:bifunctional anthranilate synthase component I family protein/class IV aminotransferase [Rhodocyclaceae bacterium]MCP5239081.1 bifunctional anthranilate synthase component I family protein/class IV aminotransferase [Zoogloeaceae bacterium]MCW5616337.1 bifunctional anthranilate synthase component I family protein/class IV aminotransferase [Rhodocyclaceae bacterium]
MDSFALLEDRLTDRSLPSSRLYTGFSHERRCDHASKLEAFWKDVETDLACGLHAVVLIDYEWGVQLQLEAPDATATCTDSALTVLLFRNLELLDSARCNAVLEGAASGGVLRATPDVTHADFDAAIEAIHAAIREGETYQINYTYRLKVLAYGEPLALYRRLRARQVVAYGAFIRLPAAAASISHVLSFSPELFLKKTGAQLEARPMKGTAALTGRADLDSQAAAALAADEKNRAENLMIVDLLRNDLGRICKTGSIRVPSLFSVEQYETLLQMTSTVTGELQPGTGFPAVLRALFPCGSITGAPKHRSMQIIDRLEASPRGLYTGAIGWLDAPRDGAGCGDFCLSVAIRTLTLGAGQRSGLWQGEMGIGAGIVIDSDATAEFAECQLKARFLTGLEPGFALFETMLLEGGAIRHVDRHLSRLRSSAAALGFKFEEQKVRNALAAQVRARPQGTAHRVRLQLEFDGRIESRAAPLLPLAETIARVRLASAPVGRDIPLAGHKTTLRERYERELALAEAQGAFDTLCFNERGELTEGARSNVFVKFGGAWFTPPLAAGVLPGIMRAVLLEDAEFAATERSIRVDMLDQAEALLVCNALRGVIRAKLDRDP